MSTADGRCPARWPGCGCSRALVVSLLVSAVCGARPVHAHPVAQGALYLDISADRILLRATVSPEEVFVAAVGGDREGASPLEIVREHGPYLLAHLQISADGRPLEGRVRRVPETIEPRPTYELEYPFYRERPAELILRQDVLSEREFAPGNPWEASYLVHVGYDGATAIDGVLLGSAVPVTIDCTRRAADTVRWYERAQVVFAFVDYGVRHILVGYDHLLFVTALVLAVASVWELIGIISAFTLAHTLTLALATLGLVRVPATVVEPMIAASIVLVALENVVRPLRIHGWNRSLVAFAFGLFHGLGFAGGLRDAMADMPAAGAAVAIAAFSVGVEIGHQMIVLPTFGVRRLLCAGNDHVVRFDRIAQRYGSAAISVAGLAYFIAAFRG